MCVCVCAGTRYTTTPNFSSLNPEVGLLVVESVAINSGYTSKVLVSPQHFFFLLLFCFDSALDMGVHGRKAQAGRNWWEFVVG